MNPDLNSATATATTAASASAASTRSASDLGAFSSVKVSEVIPTYVQMASGLEAKCCLLPNSMGRNVQQEGHRMAPIHDRK